MLEEIGQATIPMPRSGRWADAGLVRTEAADIAWRVLDAQYWGVPQRRKRIFLVADFATADRRAGEILFEPEGVQGDTPQGGGARQGAAARPSGGLGETGGSSHSLTPWIPEGVRVQPEDGVSVTLGTDGKTSVFQRQAVGNQVPVVRTYAIAGNTIGRKAGNGGNGKGFQEGISYTLNTADRHAVVLYASKNYTEWEGGELATTLRASGGFNGGGSENLATYNESMVRRLTPLECERLQGLPDEWTNIEFHGKPAPDSKRYKALGNGMAQPCADFVIRRIVESGKKGIDNIPPGVV